VLFLLLLFFIGAILRVDRVYWVDVINKLYNDGIILLKQREEWNLIFQRGVRGDNPLNYLLLSCPICIKNPRRKMGTNDD
jgi:hypothetical protein